MLQLNHYIYVFANFATYIINMVMRSKMIINIHTKTFYRKIHCLTSEFHVKFHAKNRYRTNREAMSAISVFQVKFNVEFTSQAVNFS